MRTPVDPEFDPTPRREAGVCLTSRCDGSGWIQVSEAYVDAWAGPPPGVPEGEGPVDRMFFEAVHRAYRAKRAAFAASSYPCPSCMPTQFERWSGGHWDRLHDRAGCAECRKLDPTLRRSTGRRKKEPERSIADEPRPSVEERLAEQEELLP